MNTTLFVIAVGILFILVIILGLFSLILVNQLKTTKRRAKIDAYIKRTESDWYLYLIEGEIDMDVLAPSNSVEIEAADEVLYRLQKNFNSKRIHTQAFHFIETYLEGFYHNALKSKKWSIRMNTLQRIIVFNLQFMLNDIEAMIRNNKTYTKEEVLLMYKIIAMMKPTKFIPYFLNPTLPLGEFDYRRLITPLSEKQLALLARQFDEVPVVVKHVIIDVIGDKHYIGLLPLLEYCLDSEKNPEMRIRALKSIARIDAFPEITKTERFVTSPIWEERLMAAKLFANAPFEIAYEKLKILLTDPVYQVRKQAAVSLRTIRTGDIALQNVVQDSTDTYAVEMANEMLKGG